MPPKNRTSLLKLLLCAGFAFSFGSCQKRSSGVRHGAGEDPSGLIIPSQPLPALSSDSSSVTWPNGQVSYTVKMKGRSYFEVQGLMGAHTFARRLQDGNPATQTLVRDTIRRAVLDSLKTLETVVGEEFLKKEVIGETGYYSMWVPYSQDLWSQLQKIKDLPTALTLEAVTSDPNELANITKVSKKVNEIIAAGGSKDSTDAFSGLVRIGVTNEFLQALEQELGSKADGSLVRVGITDTGITYNHPAFSDGKDQSRIAYMKDFTTEGKVYFPETAHFSVRLGTAKEAAALGASEENLLFASDVSVLINPTPDLPQADGENLIPLAKDTPLKVPSEVRHAVMDGATVKLGVLAESAYEGAEGSFDLNRNGKRDDLYGLILIIPKNSAGPMDQVVYVALEPIGSLGADGPMTLTTALDFSKAKRLHDFNSTRETAQSFAERFGVDIGSTLLKTSVDGTDVNAATVSLVGYDSGNHGTHVAGIIGGRKTLANDKDLTLARGVAPNTQIYSDRICSNSRGCSGMKAIQDLALNAKVDVINMSIGANSPLNDGYDAQSLLIDRLTQISSTLFVISAGNNGPGLQTVGNPGSSRMALTVGASASSFMMGRQHQFGVPTSADEDEDFVMPFSSRGPLNNGGFKPDITAPGSELSSVGLNMPGRPGTGVYQGTSMAAPTVAGAYALLLDAARRYNVRHPNAKLPTDVLTLRKVLVGSAKPLDVKTFNPKSNVETQGEYTWIDVGAGLLNVPAAWAALKDLANHRVATGITSNDQAVQTVYEVRSTTTGRDGTIYDGKPATEEGLETKYGAGLWIDTTSKKNIYAVGIARRLPLVAEGIETQDQQGDAFTKLVTTGEFFKLATEIHGSNVAWIKTNTFYSGASDTAPRCDQLPSNDLLTVVGQGALDLQNGGSATGESVVYFCVDRAKVAALPKGDHGALIRAYRTSADGAVTEPVPSFIIPVYLALPHESLTGGKAYTIANGDVYSQGVSRNYIDVPLDVSSLKISLSVPKATIDAAGQAQNCSSVFLDVYGGINRLQSEFSSAAANSCTGPGSTIGANEDARGRFEAEVVAPKPGLWDVHVEGARRVPHSRFQLRVDYVKALPQTLAIEGGTNALNGNLNIEIQEATQTSAVSPGRSVYLINGALSETSLLLKDTEVLDVPTHLGTTLRTYPSDVLNVAISTSGAPESDIDAELFECAVDGSECKSITQSAGPTDEETVTFAPVNGKAYKAVATGFKIAGGQAQVLVKETLGFRTTATGIVNARVLGSDHFWNVTYTLDENDPFFKNEIFTRDPSYVFTGSLTVRSPELTLAVIPVHIERK